FSALDIRQTTLHAYHAMSIAKCRAPPKLVQGIEPWTSSLPRTRSTTELYQHARGAKSRPNTSSAQRQRGRAESINPRNALSIQAPHPFLAAGFDVRQPL